MTDYDTEDKLRKITVCQECMTASCWHGEFLCQESYNAKTVDVPRWALDKLQLENPLHYCDAKLKEVTGK